MWVFQQYKRVVKPILVVVVLIFFVVHAVLLFAYGISAISTTLCFYGLIFCLLVVLFKLFPDTTLRRLLLYNAVILIAFLFVIEFALTYLFPMNKSGDDFRGVYHLLNDRKEQLSLYKTLRISPPVHTLENGQPPFRQGRHETSEFQYAVNYNELGLRGYLPLRIKPDSICRIVVLGDSFTEGFGAPEDSTYPVLLESLLGPKVQVINGGMCGSNPIYERMLYQNRLEDFIPDEVILEVNVCDLADYKIVRMQQSAGVNYLIAISHIFRFFVLNEQFERLIKNSGSEAVKRDQHKQIAGVIQVLQQFNQYLDSKGVRLLVVYVPWLPELPGEAFDLQFSKEFEGRLTHSGLPVLDLAPEYTTYLMSNGESSLQYYWRKDTHHNPRGYALMAKMVAGELKKHELAGPN